MSGTEWRLVFLIASVAIVAFAVWMRHRLQTQYPDDTSKQMQSMLGFLRGTAVFSVLVFCAVVIEMVVNSL
jgi:predicted MFS family arabinose efflux permease